MRLFKIFLFTICFYACGLDQVHTQAEQIVHAAIEAHGGQAYWQSLEQMKFRKKTWLYRPDNALEKHTDELHILNIGEALTGEIRPYDSADKSYHISYANGSGQKTTRDTVVDGSNSFLASHFVINQPFKMLDPGVSLSYLGVDTLTDGEIVDVVKAYYGNPDEDVWWFYFDQESHVLLATLIYHAPTYAFVVNEEIEQIDGLLWNTRRTTYRTDSLRNIEYVRAKFEYSEISCGKSVVRF